MFAKKLLPLTIAGLGLAAAFGTQSYLEGYLRVDGWQSWANTPSILAAGSIELAYITLALLRPDELIRDQIIATAKALVWASIAFNFGHAYEVAVPGGLSKSPRFEWLAFCQALGIAAFIPWIAYRLSLVQAALSDSEAKQERLRKEVQEDYRQIRELTANENGMIYQAKPQTIQKKPDETVQSSAAKADVPLRNISKEELLVNGVYTITPDRDLDQKRIDETVQSSAAKADKLPGMGISNFRKADGLREGDGIPSNDERLEKDTRLPGVEKDIVDSPEGASRKRFEKSAPRSAHGAQKSFQVPGPDPLFSTQAPIPLPSLADSTPPLGTALPTEITRIAPIPVAAPSSPVPSAPGYDPTAKLRDNR